MAGLDCPSETRTLTHKGSLWPFGFCLAFVSQLSWWGLVIHIIPAKAQGKEGLPLVEKTPIPVFAPLFPFIFTFPASPASDRC